MGVVVMTVLVTVCFVRVQTVWNVSLGTIILVVVVFLVVMNVWFVTLMGVVYVLVGIGRIVVCVRHVVRDVCSVIIPGTVLIVLWACTLKQEFALYAHIHVCPVP
jgi:hypothetical protein